MQNALVALIVLAALLYAVWSFMPARWRGRIAVRLGLSQRAARSGACHACDDCGACRAAGKESP